MLRGHDEGRMRGTCPFSHIVVVADCKLVIKLVFQRPSRASTQSTYCHVYTPVHGARRWSPA